MTTTAQRLTALENAVAALQTRATADEARIKTDEAAAAALTARTTALEVAVAKLQIAGIPSASATLVQQRPLKNWDSSSTPSTFYKEFAAHFKQGDVPAGKIVEWRKTDGTTVISSQADNRVTWGDGSLKDASFTMLYPSVIAAAGTDTLKGYSTSGSWNNSSWTSTSAITARDIRMEITISGTTYTLSANNEVTRGTTIRQVRSGPLSACWKIWGEFRNGTSINSTAQGSIWGALYLTFFSDGTYSAWGTIYPSKFTNASAGAFTVTDYKLKDYVGPTTLFDYSSSFTMYAGTPVYCCNTDGLHPYSGTSVDKCVVAFPTLNLADSTTTGAYDSAAFWWQYSTPTMRSAITTGTSATYIPNSCGDFCSPDQTGGNTWLGPITQQACAAFLVGDWASLRADRVNAFAAATNGYMYGDSATGFPPNLTFDQTYTGLSSNLYNVSCHFDATITVTGGSVTGASFEGTHEPLYAWYQCLASGQEPWLDMLFDQTVGILGAQTPGVGAAPGAIDYTRNCTVNSGTTFYGIMTIKDSSRRNAWQHRNYCNTEWICPTSHVMKPYLGYLITTQLAYNDAWVAPPNTVAAFASLGCVIDGTEPGLQSPWMHDYWVTSYCMSIRRGRISTSNTFVQFHIIPWCYGRGVNGCMYSCCSYRMTYENLDGSKQPIPGSIATSWSTVYVGGDFPMNNAATDYLIQVPHGSSCPVSGTDQTGSSGGGYTYGLGHSYANIFQVGGICGQIVGLSTASTIVTYMAAVETAAAVSEATWAANGYQWRIRVPA